MQIAQEQAAAAVWLTTVMLLAETQWQIETILVRQVEVRDLLSQSNLTNM